MASPLTHTAQRHQLFASLVELLRQTENGVKYHFDVPGVLQEGVRIMTASTRAFYSEARRVGSSRF